MKEPRARITMPPRRRHALLLVLALLTSLLVATPASPAQATAGGYEPVVGGWTLAEQCITARNNPNRSLGCVTGSSYISLSSNGIADLYGTPGVWSGDYPNYSVTFTWSQQGFDLQSIFELTDLVMDEDGKTMRGDFSYAIGPSSNRDIYSGTFRLTRPGWSCELTVPEVMTAYNALSSRLAPAKLEAFARNPCRFPLSHGTPTATTGTPFQISEPVAGGGARVWRCATFNVSWPVEHAWGVFGVDQMGTVNTNTVACTDGTTVRSGNPDRPDLPVAQPVTVQLVAPYDSLWQHDPVSGPIGMAVSSGAGWEFQQLIRYTFLGISPAGGMDIRYRYTLWRNTVGPPILMGVTVTP